MGFYLGNHFIEEILFAANESVDGDLNYTLDQLSTASIEISADSQEITDKKGNVIKVKYNAKSGTFNSTHALLHPAVMNAGSGSDIKTATTAAPIQMPTYKLINTGETVDLTNAVAGTVKVSARSANGADVKIFTAAEITAATVSGIFTAPATTDATTFFVEYDQNYSAGIKLVNDTETFPKVTVLKLFCAYSDPCDDESKICVIRIPRFMADPNLTINLDAENTELDYNGTMMQDYCSGTEKVLFEIYYPDQSAVVPVVTP